MKLLEKVLQIAREDPDRPAIVTSRRSHSYLELARTMGGIRNRIHEMGHGAEKRIGVVTGDDFLTYASVLAILANGSAYVPLNSKNPPDRNQAITQAADLKLVLTSDGERPDSMGFSTSILRSAEVNPGPLFPVPHFEPDELVYLLFTSGSTGTPKGVPITSSNLVGFLDIVTGGNPHQFSERDRFLQMFELTFDFSVMAFLTPIQLGASCHVVPERGISFLNIIRMLREDGITVAPMVPSVLAYMRRFFSEIRLESLRYSIFCGEALPQKLVEEWSACVPNARIQNCYGPTEATVYCFSYDWDPNTSALDAVDGVVPIGRPMEGTRPLVITEAGSEAQEGVRGELCISGPQVAREYWRDKEKTEEAFFIAGEGIPGSKFYRTGDLVYVNEKGDYIFCGRIDFQVKIDGHRVELGEIEHHAREFTGQAMLTVMVLDDPTGANGLHLFVLDNGLDVSGLNAYLRKKLPPYMLPRQIHLLRDFPLNRNGKVDRSALAALVES